MRKGIIALIPVGTIALFLAVALWGGSQALYNIYIEQYNLSLEHTRKFGHPRYKDVEGHIKWLNYWKNEARLYRGVSICLFIVGCGLIVGGICGYKKACRYQIEMFKKCPYCNKTLRRDAIVCRYCDRELEELSDYLNKI
ncbi:hypothetical protein KAX02_07295 [candidate division WOR-3 bacterium]|nr:hypothetical protein [candidate division WOR-3 bacterium]